VLHAVFLVFAATKFAFHLYVGAFFKVAAKSANFPNETQRCHSVRDWERFWNEFDCLEPEHDARGRQSRGRNPGFQGPVVRMNRTSKLRLVEKNGAGQMGARPPSESEKGPVSD
jgi:hypothetical protein